MIIKEFLVRLGVQDSFTAGLEKMLNNGSGKVASFAGSWGKQWLLAGGAVVTGLTMANVGVAKFLAGLVKADDELTMFARQTWRSRDEAYKTKSALDAMGKSLEEIRMNPRLLKEYRELRVNAEKLKPPDMSEGLSQVRGLITEYNKLKQLGGAAIQWIGFYLLKYIQKPMQQLKEQLGGINGKLTATLPEWTEKVGRALSWIVRLGSTLVRSLGLLLGAVKQLFDIIPDKVKIAMGALAASGLFIRAGPIGQLITILSAALLLLEDFFTYLDGGEAKFGKLWKTLTNLFDGFKKSGKTVLKFVSEDLLPSLISSIEGALPALSEKTQEIAGAVIDFAKQIFINLLNLFMESLPQLLGLLESVGEALLSMLLNIAPKLFDAGTELLKNLLDGIMRMLPALTQSSSSLLGRLIQTIFNKLPEILEAGRHLIMALVQGLIKTAPEMIKSALKILQNFLKTLQSHLPELMQTGVDLLRSLVSGILKALPEFLRAILELIPQAIQILAQALPELLDMGVHILNSLIDGIIQAIPELIAAIPQIVSAILSGLSSLPDSLAELGKNLGQSIWKGLSSMGPWLKNKVAEFFSSIWQGVKDTFAGDREPTPTGVGVGGHADGGVFSREHTARFAEGGRPEAVIPLTKPNRAREVLEQAARFLGGNAGGGAAEQALSSMKIFMEKAQAILMRMDATMKSGSAPISNANTINNNQKYDNRSTFNIYDSSGNPKSTATAVDRQQQMRARNLQGVYA